MIDIHHHLLPGLDDGSTDLDTSVAMARMAFEEGITHVICTPHANGVYPYSPEINQRKLDELRLRLAEEGVALTLGTGCDFHLSFSNIADAKANPTRYSINGLNYLLVEPPDFGIPPAIGEAFYELQLVGLTPILTHPERNPTLQAEPNRLAEWLRAGVLIQVTADSLTGHKGRKAERMAHELLDRRWVHFLATDAHNTSSRPPRMRQAYELVASKCGTGYAESLCVTNPLAVFEGRSFEVQEEPRGLYEEPKQPGLFSRLMESLSRR